MQATQNNNIPDNRKLKKFELKPIKKRIIENSIDKYLINLFKIITIGIYTLKNILLQLYTLVFCFIFNTLFNFFT